MNEYVITFKYNDEGYMRHIVADSEDDAVGIAFARAGGMLKDFNPRNVTDLDTKELGKKERNPPPSISGSRSGRLGWNTVPATQPANPCILLGPGEARDIHVRENFWFNEDTFRIGYTFFVRGQRYLIDAVSETNEVYVDEAGSIPVERSRLSASNAEELIRPYVIPSQLTGEVNANITFASDAYQRAVNSSRQLNGRTENQPVWQPREVYWNGPNGVQELSVGPRAV